MTTTAHEDQFGEATEKHIAMYSIEEILRRNVADLELELQRQRERAETAEEELRKAREQEPVAWLIERPAHSERPAMWLTLTTFEKKYLSDCGRNHYTFVATDALKFADKLSADEYIRHNRIKDVLVTEHIFYSDAATKPAAPATCKDGLQVPDDWRKVLVGLIAIAEKKGKRQGSPNHCHARPGIWDDDNGVLAGKPCDVCAMYDRARELLGAKP